MRSKQAELHAAAQEQRATQQRLASRNRLRVAFQGSRAIGMMRMASSGAASSKGGGGGRRKSMAPGGRGGRRKSMALSGVVPGATARPAGIERRMTSSSNATTPMQSFRSRSSVSH